MPPDAPAADTSTATSGTDIGLTTDEQALYDAMRSEPAPTGDPGHVDPETPAEPVAATPEATPAATTGSEPPVAGATPPAAAGDDGDDDDAEPAPLADGTKPPKRVSYNKFKRVEEQATKTAAELATEREKNAKAAETQARLDERLRLINEALTTQPAAPAVDDDPEPDPEADIFGHNAWLKRQTTKLRAELSEFREQVETGRQASQADQQIASTYMDDASRFAQTEPNFGPAYAYLMQVRVAQLASFHFGKDLTDAATPQLTPQELTKIKSEVAREEKQLVSTAIKAGKSPAAEVFRMAKMTGYRPAPAAGTPAAPNGAIPAAPAAAAPAAPATPANGATKPSVAAVIDGIKKGQAAALSLSDGGGAPAPVLNAEKLANMGEDEFADLLNTMSRGQLRQVMGGGP